MNEEKDVVTTNKWSRALLAPLNSCNSQSIRVAKGGFRLKEDIAMGFEKVSPHVPVSRHSDCVPSDGVWVEQRIPKALTMSRGQVDALRPFDFFKHSPR